MADKITNIIESTDLIEDCGRGHACSFCPNESDCSLNQENHNRLHVETRLGKINWVVPVIANKGGVGKSTVAANLAVALAQLGYAVGLADADIHGPNAPRFFGLQDSRVKVSERGVDTPCHPIDGRGSLRIGSLAFLLAEQNTPIVWRDAYKHDYIHHMLGSFDWGVLDYLIVDMPPGTGNELITLTDALKGCNTSAVLVSSADAIVLQDTLKAAQYCKDTAMPLLGLVENHAGVICPHCGGEFEMFPRAPETEQFTALGIDTLTRIPFTPEIGAGAASGKPVAGDSDSILHMLFETLAEECRDRLVQAQRDQLK
jgi:ATP-binding protein involved in chromosome partitioning